MRACASDGACTYPICRRGASNGPRLTAAPIGALLVGGGAYHAGLDSPVGWDLLAFVAAAGLVSLGVWRGSFTYVVIGVGTLLVALITFMFTHFENEISAPLALMLSGGLIVAAVLVLVQVRSLVRARRGENHEGTKEREGHEGP